MNTTTTDKQIIESYTKLGSKRGVADELGVCVRRVRKVIAKHKIESPSPQVLHLRERISALEGKIAAARSREGHYAEAISHVLQAVDIAEPPKFRFTEKSKPGQGVTLVVHLTDWHIGQTTKPEYVEEFGDFNYALAESRVGTLLNKILDKVAVVRKGYKCEECVVIGTADWVSGDIHHELQVTNEFPAPVQAVKAGFMLGGFIVELAAHFKTVRCECLAAGNHDRITPKPQCELGGLNSWGYVATSIAKQHVSAIDNIRFETYLGSRAVVDAAGTQYLIMHGDGIPAHMGVPHFGVDRLVMREALRRMNRSDDVHFDAVVLGHWHVANNLMFARYGGSLSGTTAYDHKYARHAAPHQTSWLVHPRHGEFDWTRWWL